MGRKLQIKRGAKAALPALAAGELALTTDEKELYYGTGTENIPVAKKVHSHTAAEVGAVATSGGSMTGDLYMCQVGVHLGANYSRGGVRLTGANDAASKYAILNIEDNESGGRQALITNLAAPIAPDQAANKQYVDEVAGGNPNVTLVPYRVVSQSPVVSRGAAMLSKEKIGSSIEFYVSGLSFITTIPRASPDLSIKIDLPPEWIPVYVGGSSQEHVKAQWITTNGVLASDHMSAVLYGTTLVLTGSSSGQQVNGGIVSGMFGITYL